MPLYQSVYRANHSTETALLKICNDALLAADEGEVTALCMIDLTAAFDVLLSKLQQMLGINGVVLAWLRSYLSNRSYRVIYAGHSSCSILIICSVPQGRYCLYCTCIWLMFLIWLLGMMSVGSFICR